MSHKILFGKVFFLLTVFVCLQTIAQAQKADFTMDKPDGCPGLSVHFTNTSTGFSSSATYKWDFGNGNTSTVKDPGANYKDPKAYTVKLTVTDGGKTDTKTNTVTVYYLPTVDFSASASSGCQPLPVTFTSTSTPGDGTIASYFWDYGDGNSESAGAQTQHTYAIPQTIVASLTVTNSHGCFDVKSKEVAKVFPSVTAAFSATQTVLCKTTDAVTFVNNSSSAATSLNYTWDFGDGTSSTDAAPQHVFPKKGIYTIKLGVKSSDGCKDEITQTNYINVANFTTDFTVPSLICQNTDAVFTNTSTQATGGQQEWLINGTEYYGYNKQLDHTFYNPDTYTLQLVNDYGNCKDTATKTITVQPQPRTPDFDINMQGACGAPVTVKFKDTSSEAVKWAWDFQYNYYNFNPTSTVQAPDYKYNSDGSYYIGLQITNAAGCTSMGGKYISIYHPNASINSSRGQYGCTNLSTLFTASSQAPLKDYSWNFNDGTTSTEAAPQHNFTREGNFNVTLAYTDSNGCKGTTSFPISILGKPSFDFASTSGTTICGNTPVNFTVTGSNTSGYYSWSFGDNGSVYLYNSAASHQYYYDSVYTVSLVISNYGCSDTVTKTNYIKVLPPFPKIASQLNSCDGLRGGMRFTEASTKATGWTWDFGDNSTAYSYNAFQDTIKHTYTKTGAYKVALTAKNGNCAVRDSVTAYVLLKQKPVLTAPQEVCGNEDLQTTISNLETNPAYVYYYNYDFSVGQIEYGDSTQFQGYSSTPDYTWRNSFHLNLSRLSKTESTLRVITNSYYFNCPDTTNYIPLKVKGPTAGFVPKKNDCFKLPVSFTDTSSGSNGIPITKWEWSFGDGQTAVTTGGSMVHNYAQPGTYYTSLTVTDRDGCSDIAYQYGISVGGTKAVFSVSQNPTLPNIPLYFYNYSNGNNSYNNLYTWQFGDGTNQSNAYYYEAPTHTYTETGIDTVRLIVTDNSSGCTDTAVQFINVKNTNLSFTAVTNFINPNSGCPPAQAKFTNTSNNVKSVKWDFGDGATADNLNYPSHIYNKPGKYKVTIYGYFYDNSVDSSYDYVTIAGPYATLTADKLFACGSSVPVTLSAEASNTTAFTWDFGDGTLVDAKDTFATHTYLTPNVYTPSLIVRDGNNCSFPYFLDKPIVIDTLHVNINRTPQLSCDSSLSFFTPDITSVAKDNLGETLSYLWDFGTGIANDTADTELSSFVYNDTGAYTVSLRVASPYGCVGQASVPVAVKQTPKATINGLASICEGLATTFTGSSNISSSDVSWYWYIQNNNFTSVQQTTEEQYFITPDDNPIRLIVGNGGCYDTVYHTLWVDAKPAVAITPQNAFVCLGNAVQLEAHDGVSYQWLQGTNISNPAVAAPFVSPLVTTSYKVEVTNEKGCISQDSLVVRVRQPFTITAPPLFYLCKGSGLPLSASGADTYQWTGTSLDNPNTATPVTTTQTPQTYTVVGFDNDHCFTDTAATEVRIAELPTVETIDDVTMFAGSPVVLNTTGSSNVTGWSWTPATYLSCANCASPTSEPKSDILYVVKAVTDHGCTQQDSVHINIICKQSLVQIPSAFTPGSDGKNDRFFIKGKGIKAIQHFVIFNRTGVPVFEKTNISADDRSAGWDGTYRSTPAGPGSYIYMADILCDTGEVFHYKGTVVLLR